MGSSKDIENTESVVDIKETSSNPTHIDLGSDLLQVQVSNDSLVAIEEPQSPKEDLNELLKNAEILLREGLIEDSKKTLRVILRRDPHHPLARSKLDEIHEVEIKEIFSRDSPASNTAENLKASIDVEAVIEKLDRDLELGLELDEIRNRTEVNESWKPFLESLQRQFKESSIKDRIDLAIAFVEMGLMESVISLLGPVVNRDIEEVGREIGDFIAANSIYSHTLIRMKKDYDAVKHLKKLVSAVEFASLGDGYRVEIFYLLGRAYESSGKMKEAQAWFDQVFRLDPNYRDVLFRVHSTQGSG